MGRALRAVFLDVGGTLWTNSLVIAPTEAEVVWRRQLAAVVPAATVDAILGSLLELEVGTRLQSAAGIEADIRGVLEAAGVSPEPRVLKGVRRAMVVPACVGVQRHPGFDEFVQTIAGLPLRRVVVSNTNWRDAEGYWRDFSDFGVAQHIHAIITSVDVGQKKPHAAMFEAALAAAGCTAAEAVMVGNSETADVTPARAMGMRTIRVCIEEPLATASAAEAVVASLAEVGRLLQGWAGE